MLCGCETLRNSQFYLLFWEVGRLVFTSTMIVSLLFLWVSWSWGERNGSTVYQATVWQTLYFWRLNSFFYWINTVSIVASQVNLHRSTKADFEKISQWLLLWNSKCIGLFTLSFLKFYLMKYLLNSLLFSFKYTFSLR